MARPLKDPRKLSLVDLQNAMQAHIEAGVLLAEFREEACLLREDGDEKGARRAEACAADMQEIIDQMGRLTTGRTD